MKIYNVKLVLYTRKSLADISIIRTLDLIYIKNRHQMGKQYINLYERKLSFYWFSCNSINQPDFRYLNQSIIISLLFIQN